MTTILIAEDDSHIRTGLIDTLESEGYRVVAAEDGEQALAMYAECKPALVVLDVMMPGRSGYDVCRAIRQSDARTPILMLTAKGEEIDKVVGLETGADDYVTKPFGIHELLARIRALLRRSAAGKPEAAAGAAGLPEVIEFGTVTVMRSRFRIERDGEQMDISARERDLIDLFYRHPDEVLDRNTLLNEVWGIDYQGTTRTLDQHIAQLRKKVESDPADPQLIRTVHGIGYRFTPG